MWAWNQPCSVLRKSKVNASNALCDAEPDVAIWADEKIGPELIGVSVTDLRIEAVGGHDEIGVRELEVGIDVALECEFHAERLATPLQDVQELLAADADEAVAGRALPRTLEDELDVVPMIECVGDLRRALGVRGAHRAHHRVRKDDAPAERVVGLVALDDGDNVLRPELLHQEPEIEPSRAAADTDDAHIVLVFRVSSRQHFRQHIARRGACPAPGQVPAPQR